MISPSLLFGNISLTPGTSLQPISDTLNFAALFLTETLLLNLRRCQCLDIWLWDTENDFVGSSPPCFIRQRSQLESGFITTAGTSSTAVVAAGLPLSKDWSLTT